MSVLLNTSRWGTKEQRQALVSRLKFMVQPDERYAAQEVNVYRLRRDGTLVCPFAVAQLPEYRILQVNGSVADSWNEGMKSVVPVVVKSTARKPKPLPERPVVVPVPVFQGALFPSQVSIHDELWTHLLRESNALLHAQTGCGKTLLSIHMAHRIYMQLHPTGPRIVISPTSPAPSPPIPTTLLTRDPIPNTPETNPFVVLVVIHRSEIEKQWVETIQQRLYGSASVQVLNRTCAILPSPYPIKFLIINTVNVDHRWTPEKPFHCSLLLLDEAHTCCTDNAIIRLLSLRPQYLIALTATPDRSDGRSLALNMVAAPRVVRKMRRLFHVYHYQTPWRTRVVYAPATGELDWNAILEAQATHPRRNRLISELILLFWRADRTIMVLCKRVEQAHLLHKMLESVRNTFVSSEVLVGGEKVASNQRQTDTERPRVLLSTFSKAGVGFSDARLDTLILAGDVMEMMLQYAGRIFRRPDVSSVIVDVVDPHVPGMKKHFKSRCQVYQDMGGVVEPFDATHLPIDVEW